MEEPIRAVIYSRVSTEDQAAHGYSMQSQRDSCREYAMARGWTIVADISDEGISGATLERPGLDDVRAMARSRQFDVLVVYDLDRFSRSAVHQMLLEMDLDRAGVRVHYVLGNYQDTDEGRLLKGIRAQIAEFERAKIKERCGRGRRAKAKSGKVVGAGRGTYGYRYEDGAYIIEESEARYVRLMFEWYLAGQSLYEITRRLTEMGARPQRGAHKWAKSSVSKILRNPTYVGIFYHNRFRTETDNDHAPRPKSEWIPVSVPAIVDQAVFDAVMARRERAIDVVRKRPTHSYLLRGVMQCLHCGRAYSGEYQKGHRYYRDGGRKHRSLRAEAVEVAVWEGICAILTDRESLLESWRERQDEADQGCRQVEQQIEQCKALRTKTLRKIEKLTETYLDPDMLMTKEEYAKARQTIQKQLDGLDTEIRDLQERLAATSVEAGQLQSLEQFAEEVQDRLVDADFETKRQIIEALQLVGKVEWIEEDVADITIEGAIPAFRVRLSSTTSFS